MSPDFQQLMQQATRLTRSGDLTGAQALLQQALRGSLPGAAAMPPSAKPFAAGDGPTLHAGVDIIDVLATEIPDARPNHRAEAHTGPHTGMSSGSHAATGLRCDYELFVPPQASQQPLPLLLMLHGCTQNPHDFAAGTRMNELALAQGFIVVYPEQSRRMNPQGCWNWFKHSHQSRGKGEPALLASLVQQLMREHAVDPRRVYVAGLSAGGAMAAILGEAYPELFAAVGVHSGLAAGAAADLPSALAAMKGGASNKPAASSGKPAIVFHGDADSTVHPCNGGDVIARCTCQPAESQRVAAAQAGGRAATRRIHRAADGQVLAEHWVVHGGTHAWSGGSPAGSYTDSRGPDASAEMLRFFTEHPLR